MWAGVASDLAELFGSGIYKALLEEPDYQLFLGRAGLKKPFPRDMRFLSKKQQEDLQSAAQMHAGLLIADLQKGESLRERRAKAQTVEGPVTLYRSWNGAYPKSKFGFWWFSEGLMREAQAQAAPLPAKQMEWLRDRLAVPMTGVIAIASR
ncbi:MAG TPA: hypothetical protein VM120_28590 [Bryobacteraceae bacterium]|nr:hypothetical protein [Bryobacteraceae bacterium]